jgi:tRNA(Ile)-lysidine synthase
MTTATTAIAPEELDNLFARFFGGRTNHRAALAVSGGGDSTALMLLFADWLAARNLDPSRCTVLTVDHGLRAAAAGEARAVGVRARALGLRHAILPWRGTKPKSGLQEAARAERYRLMGEYCLAHGLEMLFTAHTLDDQAETLLMRLARGSGLDGLCAMPEVRCFELAAERGHRVLIVRPLLGVSKARLTAFLRARGARWSEDPSNQEVAFERVRLRAQRPVLDALGLTSTKLTLSVRRLQRARRALEAHADEFLAPAAGHVVIDASGYAILDRAAVRRSPVEIQLRVLARLIAAVGASPKPFSLARLEAIATVLGGDAERVDATLGRTKITVRDAQILIMREPGRARLPRLMLAGGESKVWDGRFRVSAAAATPPLEVRALGPEGLASVRSLTRSRPPGPRGALLCAPAFYRGGTLLAAPSLAFFASAEARSELAAAFLGASLGALPASWAMPLDRAGDPGDPATARRSVTP